MITPMDLRGQVIKIMRSWLLSARGQHRNPEHVIIWDDMDRPRISHLCVYDIIDDENLLVDIFETMFARQQEVKHQLQEMYQEA